MSDPLEKLAADRDAALASLSKLRARCLSIRSRVNALSADLEETGYEMEKIAEELWAAATGEHP